ncbi:hypothetical protein DAEQUDRAFT_72050 [Daedalea quercina L-15889]|uniref:Uncharacterized protein n=1 Tax=Daedalea quercina L-15889 TaxID=1314783 RepID=A0A165L5G6_9APHY|nr:hypothetical protein DAEQUDRAFT_72050 [Daedalea quercina L-15889]
MTFNFNIEGAITAILGLLLPFIFFITFRPRTILVTLKQRIEELRGVLRDVEDENLPEDPSHLGWVEARERLEKFEDQARSLRDEVYRDCLTSKLSEVKAIVCGLTCKLFSLRRKVSSLLADVSAAATYARRRQQDAIQQYHTVAYIAAARGRSATEAGQNNGISMEQHRQLYTLPNRQTSIRVAEDINPTTISIAGSALQHVGDDSDSQSHSTMTSHPSNNEWNASAHVPPCKLEVTQDTGVGVFNSEPSNGVHPQNPLALLLRNTSL